MAPFVGLVTTMPLPVSVARTRLPWRPFSVTVHVTVPAAFAAVRRPFSLGWALIAAARAAPVTGLLVRAENSPLLGSLDGLATHENVASARVSTSVPLTNDAWVHAMVPVARVPSPLSMKT